MERQQWRFVATDSSTEQSLEGAGEIGAFLTSTDGHVCKGRIR
jgi:hypothetical protein